MHIFHLAVDTRLALDSSDRPELAGWVIVGYYIIESQIHVGSLLRAPDRSKSGKCIFYGASDGTAAPRRSRDYHWHRHGRRQFLARSPCRRGGT